MIQNICDAFGLKTKEQKVFGALVENGPQPASRIARFVSLPRNTTRGMLDKLVASELVSRATRKGTHYYSVDTPARIVRSLERREKQMREALRRQIQVIRRSAESLTARSGISKRPRVMVYDGLDGLERVYDDTLSAGEIIVSWASFDANREALPDFFRDYYQRRAKKGVRIRSVHPDTPLARKFMLRNKKDLREALLCPLGYSWSSEIQIYDNKVNIVSWKDKVALIIESAEIAATLKEIFKLNYDLIGNLRRRKKAMPTDAKIFLRS